MRPRILSPKEVKLQAKMLLKVERKRLTLLNLPAAVLTVIYFTMIYYYSSYVVSQYSVDEISKMITSQKIIGFSASQSILLLGFQLFIAMIVVGSQYTLLDWLRSENNESLATPIKSAFRVFKPDYFFQIICMWIISNFLIQIGLSYLIIPGLYLQVVFSQQYFIYKEANSNGRKLGIISSMFNSYRILQNHKWDYFMLELSFVGWNILNVLTGGLLSFWLFPYKNSAYTIFYKDLIAHKKG
ncbi:DUF975 family protein [Companilactobacillus sp. DQM5]|uniref:DUF975 family protein n=1 Tax=Companilactobacillus sp. DQM5 TaxID=3463359 RepID=UPI004058B0B2